MRIARVVRTAKVSGPCYTRLIASAVLFSLVSAVFSSAAFAATINYGNFGPIPPGISFLQVTEGSPTNDPLPLYGPPDPSPTGLDFDTTDDFTALSNGGGVDSTDGKLNFTISAPVSGVSNVSLFEEGDYSVIGAGGPLTGVYAFANIIGTITEVNGLPTLINLPQVTALFSDLLPPIVPGAGWSLGLTLDVASALGPNQIATEVEIAIDNRLIATSELLSEAFIIKKNFQIHIVPDPSGGIPEPTTFVLGSLLVGLVGLTTRRRS
jgi:hypothetical protein